MLTQLDRLTVVEIKERIDHMIDQHIDCWLEVTLHDTERMSVIALVAWLEAKDDVQGVVAARGVIEEVAPCVWP